MLKRAFFALSILLTLFSPTGSTNVSANKEREIEILRDDFWVPHIFARTLEDAAFASGYVQAEDRLEELLKNYRKAEGTMAEVFGPEWLRHDYIQRVWKHAAISREKYMSVSPKMRACMEAFQAGVKQFMTEHPEKVPKWAPELHPSQIVALGRYIIWGWPLGEANGDLRRAGIEPDPTEYRGSNQMLLAPEKTAMKAPIAVIDPHLSWYGEFRFYELRIYADDFAVSGVSILGLPFPSLGHSRFCSVAMTTGGPDTSDIFEEEIHPRNASQYKYEGGWREIDERKEVIKVLDGGQVVNKEVLIEYTNHGPIVAHKDGKAYSMAIPYQDEVGLADQIYEMYQARNLEEMKAALSKLQLMGQNIMVATVQGDIYYVRNGRVPVRPKGCDPSKPMPGSDSSCLWKGIHPFTDLVQLANPPQGYMQNNNVSPFAMMKDSPLRAEKYLPYIYNSQNDPGHQRAVMTLEQLDAAKKVTIEQAIDLAFSNQVHGAELWQARLKTAWEKVPDNAKTEDGQKVYELIQRWNGRSDADSWNALSYYAFKTGFVDPAVGRSAAIPDSVSDEDFYKAVERGAAWLKSTFGKVEVPYGQYFRIGREGGKTYPVGGGTLREAGMATPRAIGFRKVGNEMVGNSGQTSTQVVIMTKPPQSFTVLPLGESDDKDGGHWDDQAEKLFSKNKMKPSYFLDRKELMRHVIRTKVLRRP